MSNQVLIADGHTPGTVVDRADIVSSLAGWERLDDAGGCARYREPNAQAYSLLCTETTPLRGEGAEDDLTEADSDLPRFEWDPSAEIWTLDPAAS